MKGCSRVHLNVLFWHFKLNFGFATNKFTVYIIYTFLKGILTKKVFEFFPVINVIIEISANSNGILN